MKKKLTLETFQANELPLLADVVSFSNNLEMSLYANSTVVKSPEVVFRGILTSSNRFLGEEYLLNFQRSDADFGRAIGVGNYGLPMVIEALNRRSLIEDKRSMTSLPRHEKLNAPIGPVIRSRRSIRTYSGKSLKLATLSTILFHAQGVTGHQRAADLEPTVSLGESEGIPLRAAPSGGALYPIAVYAVPLRVDGLAAGAYRYVPEAGEWGALQKVKNPTAKLDPSGVAQFGNIEVGKAAVLFAYVYRLFHNSRKYGDSGLAFALIEAGQIAQNIHLACTALGLGSCDVGGFRKHLLEKVLGLDGVSQHVVHLTVVGC